MAFVPPRPIEQHDDALIRVTRGDLGQKQRHAVAVDVGQNQPVETAVANAHRSIGIDILVYRQPFLPSRTSVWKCGIEAISRFLEAPSWLAWQLGVPYLSTSLGRSCGNKITSRIDAESVSNMTSRSIPIPSPAVGGMPYSKARTKSAS